MAAIHFLNIDITNFIISVQMHSLHINIFLNEGYKIASKSLGG
jgi:hypothetical protein